MPSTEHRSPVDGEAIQKSQGNLADNSCKVCDIDYNKTQEDIISLANLSSACKREIPAALIPP